MGVGFRGFFCNFLMKIGKKIVLYYLVGFVFWVFDFVIFGRLFIVFFLFCSWSSDESLRVVVVG